MNPIEKLHLDHIASPVGDFLALIDEMDDDSDDA